MRGYRGSVAAVVLIAGFCWPGPASAGEFPEFTVNSTEDAVDAVGDGICATAAGTCTLRAAFMEAEAAAHTTITLPAGRFNLALAPSTGCLFSATDCTGGSSKDGDLVVQSSVTLRGAGENDAVIDGGDMSRVFVNAHQGSRFEVSDLTIANGHPRGPEDDLPQTGWGGGIMNYGQLQVNRVTLTGNQSQVGGAIFNVPTSNIHLENSTLSNNLATTEGGGMRIDGPGTVVNTRIIGNRVGSGCCPLGGSTPPGTPFGEGGGIDMRALGDVTIANSTITGNHAVLGGGGINYAYNYYGALVPPGVKLGGRLIVQDSTISGNTSDFGPGNCQILAATLEPRGQNTDDDGTCGFAPD